MKRNYSTAPANFLKIGLLGLFFILCMSKMAWANNSIAAKIGNSNITFSQLHQGIENQVFDAKTKVYELELARLNKILLDKFIALNPSSKGLNKEQFIEKHILAKAKVTSKKEVNDFIKERNIPKEHVTAQLTEKIKTFLYAQKRDKSINEWVKTQAKIHNAKIFLMEPVRPTFNVKVGDSPYKGPKKAKVTIIEFTDFECQFCAKGADTIAKIFKKYKGKVKVVLKNFPLPFHKNARSAAMAAFCAGEQKSDFFWKMHDLMFENQSQLNFEGLSKFAKNLGLKTKKFNKCLKSNKYAAKIDSDISEGERVSVKSTPTFFVNGKMVNGAQPIEIFDKIITQELKDLP